MELFLLCSEDAESDVRMVADECLNKVIKVRTFIYSSNRFLPLTCSVLYEFTLMFF